MKKTTLHQIFCILVFLMIAPFASTARTYVEQSCDPTPMIYKVEPLPDYYHSNNMRNFIGMTGRAYGRKLRLEGRVYDKKCVPIPNASIEIWHKNYNGVYNDDIRHIDLWDKNFTGTGSAQTDNWGQFAFFTIFPGTNKKNEMPHVDIRVRHPDFPILETRLYFEGFYTGRDQLLKGLSDYEKYQLIANREGNNADELNFSILLILDGQTKYKIN